MWAATFSGCSASWPFCLGQDNASVILKSGVRPVGREARLFFVPERLPGCGIQEVGSSGLEDVWNDADDATQDRPAG